MLKWIAAVILLLLVWRKLYPQTTIVLPQTMSAGDGFNAGCNTIAVGVTEPCTGMIVKMPHMIFPVEPPPIQIQKPVPFFDYSYGVGGVQTCKGCGGGGSPDRKIL